MHQDDHDQLEYVLELQPGASIDAHRVAEALREAVKVRGEIRLAPLPKDAKRIDDRRTWK